MEYKNIGLHFYRGYYKDYFGKEGLLSLKEEDAKEKTDIKNKQFKELNDLSNNELFKVKQDFFDLRTDYPGLYTGSGYTFGAGVKGEFQLGFLFDHTTGLPYIPGSSIKGCLRAAFPNNKGGKLTRNTKYRDERINFIWDEILNNIRHTNQCTINLEETSDKTKSEIVNEIELEIFEGRNIIKEKEWQEKRNEKKEIYYSVYERDIFHDAYIEKPVKDGKTKRQFLGLDYITPHTEGPLKNPTPLPFLKILPGVTIRFQFTVQDGYYLKKEGKLYLFKEIIKTFGIGAKTNVGYGQFSEIS